MGKRKAEGDLSRNKNTKRERRRYESLSNERKEFEKQKKADNMAEARAVAKLRTRLEFMSLADEQRAQLIQQCRDATVERR